MTGCPTIIASDKQGTNGTVISFSFIAATVCKLAPYEGILKPNISGVTIGTMPISWV